MFNLTSSEKRTALFVIVIVLASGLYQWIQPNKIYMQSVDYSKSDSFFHRLSEAVEKELPVTLPDSQTTTEPESISGTVVETSKNKASKEKISEELLPSSININTASESELEKLPRIGPKIAARIINYRKEVGYFTTTDDLLKVKGIGKKTLENLLPYIYVQ